MKKFNFKSSFHEKLKMLLLAIGLIVTSLTTQVLAADTYAIAGSFNSWSTSTNSRSGTGAISITFSSTGNYTFKIVKNGTWCGNSGTMTRDNCTSWGFTYNGGDNCTISVDKTGTYTFNITNDTPTLSVTYPDPTWSVAGGFNSWSTTTNTFSSSKTSISLTNGTTYEFKVYRKEGNVYYGNSGTMTSGNCSNWDFSSSADNAKITANITGTYVVELVNNTPRITVHYPVAISYDKGANGTGTISGGVKTWGVNYTLSSSTFTRDGYTQDGWSTSDGGDKAYNLGGTYSTHTAQTFYPHWVENMSTVTLTASPTGKGSFTIGGAAASSTTAGVTTTRSVTAVPISGYHFVSWAVSGGATISSTSDNPTTVTGKGAGAAATLTATFEADAVNSLTVTAGTHVTTVSGSVSPVTLGSSYAINATAFESGYQFLNWTASPAANGTFDNANSASTNVTVNNGSVTVTANAEEIMRTITISGGTVYGGAATSTTAGVATSAKITANAPAEGKKFTGWTLGTGVSLKTGSSLTDRTIEIYSTADATVTANYADRASVKMYFAKPLVWGNSTFYVHTFKNGGGVSPNAAYPGVACSTTETINCVTYYTYQYYTEGDGIGGDATGNAAWDRVIFGCNDDAKKTGDLTISNGHYYYWDSSTTGSASAVTNIWYIKGTMNDWGTTNPITLDCANNKGTVNINLTKGTTYEFKVYDVVNTKMWSNSTDCGTASGTDHTIKATMASAVTLYDSDPNVMKITANVTGPYTFEVSNTNTTSPKIKVTFPVSYAVNFSRTPTAAASAPTAHDNTANVDISSGDNVLSGHSVTFTKQSANSGYSWYRWENGSGSNLGNGNTYTTTISAATTVVAKYTENDYAVTVNAGTGGTVASGSVTGHKDTKADLPTATPYPGYRFVNWTTTAGTLTNATSATTGKINGLTSTATVTANFARSYAFVEGRFHVTNAARDGNWTNSFTSGDWGTTCTNIPFEYDGTNHRFFLHTYAKPSELTTQISNQYPYFYVTTSSASSLVSDAVNFNPSSNQDLTTAGTKKAAQTATHTYNYKFNSSNESGYVVLYFDEADVWFELEQTLSYDANGGTGDAPATTYYLKGTNATAAAANTFTRTGYTFNGWKTGKSSGTSYAAGASVPMNSNITLYAQWAAIGYTVILDLDETNHGDLTGKTTSQNVTYDGATTTVPNRPTGTTGYGLDGYYTDHNGGGTKVINGDGTWIASVEGYTDENKKWVHAGDVTLYAYYKAAEIASITLSAATIAPSENLTVTAVIDPSPVGGTTHVEWRLLHANENPYSPQPSEFSTNGASKTFAVPGTSATYIVEAKLRLGSTLGSGDVLDTETQSFRVAGDHKVTVQYKCGDAAIKASETITGKPLDWTEVTAPTIVGYQFHHWILGDGISIKDGETAGDENTPGTNPINIKAIYDGTLTAVYTQKRMIYFYNTLNWSDVYVYFYKDGTYWNNSSGTGTDPTYYNGSHNADHKGHMLPVAEGSKIYYFDAEGASIPAGYTNVAFTEKQQDNCWYFYDNNKVSRRGDYKSSMPMFVPLGDQPEVKKNSNTASYYCEGYWMNYPANTGYTLRIYSTPEADNATGASREYMIPYSEDMTMPLKQGVEINFSGESWFIIYCNDGTYLEGSHTFKQTNHGDKKITSTASASTASKMRLISDGSGIYTFTLSFYGDGGNPEAYDYYLNVDFPAAVGDYRIIYKDNATWSNGAHGNNYATWYHPSDIIGKNTSETETKEDIVSFFISKNNSPAMKFQYISAINAETGAVTWTDVTSGAINLNNFSSDITAAGVYNIYVSQPKNGGSISVDSIKPYTGNYYIRTDCAGNTKWDNYRAPDHMMNYSEYSFNQTQDPFSHYYAHWIQKDDKPNIKFCVANDYSSAISDTLTRETAAGTWAQIESFIDEHGNVQCNANVRFMWNKSTNKVSRAYIDGAQESGSTFLVLLSSDHRIKDETGTNELSTITFQDNQNWIYEANIKAQPQAAIKLRSTWINSDKNIVQYFKGTSSATEQLIGGSGTSWYDIRLLYDFKTNRLVAAYKPSGNIDDELKINADVMFIREHQGDIAQLTFTNGGKITEIKTAYAVLRFNKWTLNNKDKSTHTALINQLSRFERDIFYVSFPFRVSMEEVFGFGTYGTHWIIEYYDGANRAEKGYWQESPPNWKFITNRKGKYFEPNQGYIIALDLDELKENSSIWDNGVEDVELFFPSSGTLTSITSSTVTHNLPAHLCEINWSERPNGSGGTLGPDYDRRVKDSHWNVLSVPTYVNPAAPDFANTEWITEGEGHVGPNFLYEWNSDDNSVSPVSGTGYSYHAMHAYLVQYCGNVTWTSSVSPALPARRNPNYRGSYEFRLELMQNNEAVDQTYVKLTDDEAVTTGFEFNYDMSKEMNKNKANIYTFIGTEEAAGNCLPLTDQTTVVPVGVQIAADGEYIFSMPDGTENIGVTLIDKSNNTRTNLALTDYAVYLETGDHNERFVLEISPIQQIETGVEAVTGDRLPVTGVCKKLIDGVLYIVKDGKVFDARGARIQ